VPAGVEHPFAIVPIGILLTVTWTIVRFVHLLSAAIWVGGQAALFLAVPVIRQHTPDPGVILGTIGRRFGGLAGPALVLLLVTGMAQASHFDLWDAGEVHGKLTIWIVVFLLTGVHGVIGARIARARSADGDIERLRTISRAISVVNLALGVVAIYLAASLAS
jgi:uncharacterized membrane protein